MEQSGDNRGTQFLVVVKSFIVQCKGLAIAIDVPGPLSPWSIESLVPIAIDVQRGNAASVMATIQGWAEFAFMPTDKV